MAGSAGAEPEMRIVLLGLTGGGRSSSGNTLLGRPAFRSDVSSSSVTRECQVDTAVTCGRRVTVIDTPGFFHTQIPEDDLKREVMRCVTLCPRGPHAFLLVLKADAHDDEERAALRRVLSWFGDEALRYTLVLFTRGDELDGPVQDFYGGDADMAELVRRCGGRSHAFDNERPDERGQVAALLDKLDRMVDENGGGCYTNEMFRRAGEAVERVAAESSRAAPGRAAGEVREEAARLVAEALLKAAVGLAVGVCLGALLGAAAGAALTSLLPALLASGAAPALAVAAGGVVGGVQGVRAALKADGPKDAARRAASAVFQTASDLKKRITDVKDFFNDRKKD
ncbi:GTPase IMAP family member 4-like [Lepisosteus oculatus]|uniref:GTPase IMAP family member 4-like n=1 Tax=Lepisosteus oculatus TaxID=7918 RepID=UPI0035F51063